MVYHVANLRDLASEQTEAWSELGALSLEWYREQPLWKRLLLATLAVAAAATGFLVLIFHQRIIKVLVRISDMLLHSYVGGVVFFTLIFLVGFPPLLGFTALLMLCGMVYGFPQGWPLLASASITGSFASFLVFRHLFKDQAASLVRKNEKFRAFSEILLEDDSLFLLILIRLCPLPYSLLNGALASIPHLSASTFLMASIITSPKMFVHIFVGHAIKNLGDDQRPASSKWIDLINIVLPVLALLVSSYIIYNRMEIKLQSFRSQPESYEEMTFNLELDPSANLELDPADYDDDNFIIGFDDEILEAPDVATTKALKDFAERNYL